MSRISGKLKSVLFKSKKKLNRIIEIFIKTYLKRMWFQVLGGESIATHITLYSQSTDSNQPTKRAPSVPDGPWLAFSCWSNIRWHCWATWKPSKEMMSKTEEVRKVAMQHQSTKGCCVHAAAQKWHFILQYIWISFMNTPSLKAIYLFHKSDTKHNISPDWR